MKIIITVTNKVGHIQANVNVVYAVLFGPSAACFLGSVYTPQLTTTHTTHNTHTITCTTLHPVLNNTHIIHTAGSIQTSQTHYSYNLCVFVCAGVLGEKDHRTRCRPVVCHEGSEEGHT